MEAFEVTCPACQRKVSVALEVESLEFSNDYVRVFDECPECKAVLELTVEAEEVVTYSIGGVKAV